MNMLTDLGRFIVEVIGYLWPMQTVYEWEQGSYYVFGNYWLTVGPGLWPKIPYFIDVRTEGTVSQTYSTPVQTITTKDGGTLTFRASMKLRVLDLGKAYNSVLQWDRNAIEDASAALSDKLAEVDVARLEPASRGRLIAACKLVLDNELKEYGLVIDKLRFSDFARNMPVYRLLNDSNLTRDDS